MSYLFLQGDDVTYSLVVLGGDSSAGITLVDTGTLGFGVDSLNLFGTSSVSIHNNAETDGFIELRQLADLGNDLTTVTIKGLANFYLGSASGNSGDGVVTDVDTLENNEDTTVSLPPIHSSLTLIDASATTGQVAIYAGATNTTAVSITYTGLTIKGGSGLDFIENDAKKGIVTDGNSNLDNVDLGGAGATAILGTGAGDQVTVGLSFLGTSETAGSALGDKVTFGAAATDRLIVGTGAEAGSTAGTTSIGLTKVHDAAGGMSIEFTSITTSSNIVDETTAVASSTTLTTAENAAVDALAGAGVAYFNYKGSEYFIAANAAETAVSSSDAIVKLVGVVDLTATIAAGVVTLHA
jgi:hypothetical protein